MVLGDIPGRVGRCREFKYIFLYKEVFLDSSAVEHSAVNRRVVGSNPTRGAILIYNTLIVELLLTKIKKGGGRLENIILWGLQNCYRFMPHD